MKPCVRCGSRDRSAKGKCKACDRRSSRARQRGTTIDRLVRLWHLQQGLCALTGDALPSLDGAEVDHIVPRSRGGPDDPDNLRLVCRAANRAKGNLLDEEFFMLCERVIEHAKSKGR